MARLDPALWNNLPGMQRLLGLLGAADGELRFVGGAVRDWLLGLTVADIDFATSHLPDEVMTRLQEGGVKVVPTGLAHGTVTAIAGGRPHEITTLRRDVQSFGRHAEVAFTQGWQEDAARRDFTINALYADPQTGEVLDYFGGLADLDQRIVRFIGDPLQRIAEDHLRILRFFRFSARFSSVLEPAGLAACIARANDLMALSRERIRDELLKMLALPDPSPTVETMVGQHVLKPVLPEIAAEGVMRLRALIAAEASAGTAPEPLRRLAALLPADPAIAADIGARLKLSNADKARLTHAADRTPVAADPRATAYRIGSDATLDRLLLTGDSRAGRQAALLGTYRRPRLPVSGKDLIAMGLPPGPIVSQRLAQVEQSWIDAGFPDDINRVKAMARNILELR